MLGLLWLTIMSLCGNAKGHEWMSQAMHLAIAECQKKGLILRDKATVRRVARRAIHAMVRLDDAHVKSIIKTSEKLEAARQAVRISEAKLSDLGECVLMTPVWEDYPHTSDGQPINQ